MDAHSFALPLAHPLSKFCPEPAPGEVPGADQDWNQSEAFEPSYQEQEKCDLFGALDDSDEESSTRQEFDPSSLKFSDKRNNRYIRWTRKEHEKFVEGLRTLGKNWNLIHKMVGSRSSDQTRSHAQKYFNRIRKMRANPDKLPFITDDGHVIEDMLDKHTRRIIGQELP